MLKKFNFIKGQNSLYLEILNSETCNNRLLSQNNLPLKATMAGSGFWSHSYLPLQNAVDHNTAFTHLTLVLQIKHLEHIITDSHLFSFTVHLS